MEPQSFITAFISARYLSLSWASSIQSILPHPTSWRSILILSSHLRLGLPSRLVPSRFPTKTLYTPLLFPTRATCPAYLILLDFVTRKIFGEQYRSLSSSLCSFLHSPVTSSPSGSNTPLNTPFSNTLSLRSSLNVSEQPKLQIYCVVILRFHMIHFLTKTGLTPGGSSTIHIYTQTVHRTTQNKK